MQSVAIYYGSNNSVLFQKACGVQEGINMCSKD